MELQLFPAVLTVPFYLTALIILIPILILIQKRAKTHNNNNPPQPKGAWPVIGHLHLLGQSEIIHKVLGDMADTCGPVFTLKLGAHRALVVSDSKIAKECLTTKDMVFASRPRSKTAEIMGYNYALVSFAPYGDYWRKTRKILTLEVLSQRRVEMLEHVRVSELRESMTGIYDAWVVSNKEMDQMVMVEMSGWVGNLILNLVLRIISGKRFPLNDEGGIRAQNAVKRFFELAGTFVVSDFIPSLSVFDIGGYEKQMKIAADDMDDIIEGWLEDYRRKKESGLTQQHVFIDVLYDTLQGASQDDFPGFDRDKIIKAACLVILIAGPDSIGANLTWALSLLLNNPKTLETAKDEIDKHVGKEKPVQESDLKKLVYIEAIIKETLRLYPPGPLSLPHESMEDCTVSGYNIPKGTRLLFNLWKMQRDPKIWSDPDEFKPERFLTDHKDIDVKGKHFEYLPFGSGRRMCPGVSFSLPAMGLILASLIQHFELKLPSDEPVDMIEKPGLTSTRATPLEVLLAPRLSANMYHYQTD